MRLHVRHVVPDFGTKVVGGHMMYGFGTENALAVEFSAVEQHLPKAHVIADGGKRAGTAAVKFRRCIEQLDRLRLLRERVVGKRAGETSPLSLRGVERGTFMSSGPHTL